MYSSHIYELREATFGGNLHLNLHFILLFSPDSLSAVSIHSPWGTTYNGDILHSNGVVSVVDN